MGLRENGYLILPKIVPPILVEQMREGLDIAYANCRKIQLQNGIENSENTCHHLIGQHESFMNYLLWMETLNPYLEQYFGGKYILNSFGGNLLTGTSAYANNIHRDQRSYSTENLMMNTIVLLDDFTKDNGATWLMNRGHIYERKPDQDEFDDEKFQIIAPAGSVVLFNSNLWHQAGINNTDKPRRSVTPMFSRPFMKQQFDYEQFYKGQSPWAEQILGCNARVPATLSDWYQLPDKRMYKKDQE